MQPCAHRARWPALCVAALLTVGTVAQAEPTATFFRVVGPFTGGFTRIESNGALTWTNPVLNTTCHVQIATSSLGNWRDFEHSFVTTAVTSVRIFDVSSPERMTFVPAGLFRMGDAAEDHPAGLFGELEEAPVHTVQLGAFYIGTREVTQGEWDNVRAWASGHGYTIGCVGNGKDTNHPVAAVCWHDAVLWCNAKSEKEGLTPCYYTDATQTGVYRSGVLDISSNAVKWEASGYRLPSEAEWEYAARGGAQGSRFAFGPTVSHTQANYFSTNAFIYDASPTPGLHPDYDSGEPCTSPGGAFAGNGYGLCDVAGNVSEWCWDRSDGVTESCGDCSGSGKVACPNCGGSGSTGCPTCYESGMVGCGSCGGGGSITISCGDCSGSGGQSCSACEGDGSVDVSCSVCGGGGDVNCSFCGGSMTEPCMSCTGIGTEPCTQCSAPDYTGPCGTCGASGTMTCPICGGADPECGTCAGSGTVTCSTCGGSGTAPCIYCGGDGEAPCGTCGGSGNVTCSGCAGSGLEACGNCGGNGWVTESCSTCSGTGSIACEGCGGTGEISFSCPTCGGSGGVACPHCGGSGSLTCGRCSGDGDETCSLCTGRGELWSSVYYSTCGTTDPLGPAAGDKRIVRGGAWSSDAEACRVSRRAEAPPSATDTARGFRIVRAAVQ